MVYPLPPDQGAAIDARRREIQRRLDELDVGLQRIKGQLESLDPRSPEARRLTSQRQDWITEAVALLADLDFLDDPDDFLDDMGDEEGAEK